MNAHDHREPLPEDFDWNDLYAGDASDYMPPDPLVLELASALPPGDALDVGCGAGGLLVALAKRGWNVHGIDLARTAIAAAEAVFAREGVTGSLAVVDAARYRPSRTYDLVTSCFALPMKRAAQIQAYGAIRDAVAPGGTVIIEDFDPSMRRFAPFRGFDAIDVRDLEAAFEGFETLRAEVVPTPSHDRHGGTLGDETWTASLLIARRPH